MDQNQINAANDSFDFTGIEEAKGLNITQPGVIDEFTIIETEYIKSEKKGTPGLKCTFEAAEDKSSFNHTFYLTANALTRVQTLSKYALKKDLTGPLTGANLCAMFKGCKLPLKVTAQIADNGKVYPNVPFGGFSAYNIADLSFSNKEQEDIETGKALAVQASVNNADAEGNDGMATQSGDAAPGNTNDAGEF